MTSAATECSKRPFDKADAYAVADSLLDPEQRYVDRRPIAYPCPACRGTVWHVGMARDRA